jgi:glutamine amidotransferase
MVHPILDKYYERDPYHVRSSAFVQAKGLVSNEKAPTTSETASPGIDVAGSFGQYKQDAGLGAQGLSPEMAHRQLNRLDSQKSSHSGDAAAQVGGPKKLYKYSAELALTAHAS